MNDVSFVRLSDGRRLAYAEYGDPEGKPVLYFHGWPGSGMGGEIFHEYALAHKLRIIAPARPGFGYSDFQEDRTLLDWPQDVRELVRKLGLSKFSILAVSGGCPYALACAFSIPKLIGEIITVGGLGPLFGVRYSLPLRIQLAFRMTKKFPGLANQYLRFWSWAYKNCIKEFTFIMRLFVSGDDKAAFRSVFFEKLQHQSTMQAFHQGTRAALHEAIIFGSSWGFDIKKIHCKVKICHGINDSYVPIIIGKYLHGQVKSSKSLYLNDGHFPYLSHMDEILKDLS